MTPQKTEKPQDATKSRGSVIEAVRTPLGLCALLVLVIEAILVVIARGLTGGNLTILVIGMIVALLVMVFAAAYAVLRPPGQAAQLPPVEEKPVSYKYDAFLSVPMAGFSDDAEYRKGRKDALELIEKLRTECDLKTVFYAAQFIESKADFDQADLSVIDDLAAIQDSKYFIMVYQSRIVSSCIFEAGYAIALRKRSLYFVRQKKDLPFLLQQAGEALNSLVRIRDVPDIAEMTKLISKHKMLLFPP